MIECAQMREGACDRAAVAARLGGAGVSVAPLEQKLPMSDRLTVVWSEPRTPWPAQGKLSRAVLDPLAQIPGVHVAVLPHLYDLAPDGAGVDCLRSLRGPLLVLAWLYARAAFWLLESHGVKGRMGATAFLSAEELPDGAAAPQSGAPPGAVSRPERGAEQSADQRTIWCIDLREHEEPQALVAEIERIVRETTGRSLSSAAETPAADSLVAAEQVRRIAEPAHARWYPVVDYSRCAGCLECLNFCLFGVFDTGEDDSLVVVLPDQCRTGCPACARVCPSAAIMFPMHSDPAIAGDPRAPMEDALTDLFPLLELGAQETADPRALAAAERGRAVEQSGPADPGRPGSEQAPGAEQSSIAQTPGSEQAAEAARPPAPQPPGKPRRKRETTEEKLDRLVDELDELDQPDV